MAPVDGTLVHGGQALMAWAVGNAPVNPKALPSSSRSRRGNGQDRPVMAASNATALMKAKAGIGVTENILGLGAPVRMSRPIAETWRKQPIVVPSTLPATPRHRERIQ